MVALIWIPCLIYNTKIMIEEAKTGEDYIKIWYCKDLLWITILLSLIFAPMMTFLYITNKDSYDNL